MIPLVSAAYLAKRRALATDQRALELMRRLEDAYGPPWGFEEVQLRLALHRGGVLPAPLRRGLTAVGRLFPEGLPIEDGFPIPLDGPETRWP